MAWTLQTLALQNNVATNGMTVNAYVVTRFALPATDAAVPDGNPADAGPATSAADPVAGAGYFTLVVPDGEPYWLQASGGGDGHTYWYGPIVGVLDSTQQAYLAGADVTSSRRMSPSTVANLAAGDVGASLPRSTINVTTTTGYASSGKVLFNTAGGYQLVNYLGITGTSFTGCTGGTGTTNQVTALFQAYQAGSARRSVRVVLSCNGGYASALAQIHGTVKLKCARAGILNIGSAGAGFSAFFEMTFMVDPNGGYGVYIEQTPVSVDAWFEDDFPA